MYSFIIMERYYRRYFFLLLIKFCHSHEHIHQELDKTELNKCVTTILQRIEAVNTTDVTLINVDRELAMEIHSLPQPVRFSSRTFYWPNNSLCNDLYVIQCKNYFECQRGLVSLRKDPFWSTRANFIIIIEYPGNYIQDISAFLAHNHIYNCAVITYAKDRSILLYSFGHEYDKCGRPIENNLHLHTVCSEIQEADIDLIFSSEEITDLRGCHVKFVSHNYWPFVSFNNQDAIENYLLKLVRQYQGISVELEEFGSVENFGGRLDNFTYTGMLHEIEIYNVEGAIGGFILTFNRMTNLDFIDPYLVDHYRIVIPRAKILNKWSGVLKQIGLPTLWAIFITFCTICAAATFMGLFKKQFSDTSRDILIVWGYFFNNIHQKQIAKAGAAYRIVVLNILIYVFIVSNATQASLLSATTHPLRDDQPHTPEEVTSKYRLLVSPSSHAHLLKNPVIDLVNANTNCSNTFDCMMKVMLNEDQHFFALSSDIYHQSYVWNFADENGEVKIHTIRETVGTLLQTIYLRRGSLIRTPFNILLHRVRSAGLIDKFLDRLHFKERLKHKFHARKPSQSQSLKGLKGVFMILIYGYSVSVISFILEFIRRDDKSQLLN